MRRHLFWGIFAVLVVAFIVFEGGNVNKMSGKRVGMDLMPGAGNNSISFVMPNGDVYKYGPNEALAQPIGPSGLVQTQVIALKGTPITLYGGAISASIGLSTVGPINMINYHGGQLQLITGGSNPWTLAFYTSEDGTNFSAPYYYTGSAWAAWPSVIASNPSSFTLPGFNISPPGIACRWLKIVPTLTAGGGTNPVTWVFTPSQ